MFGLLDFDAFKASLAPLCDFVGAFYMANPIVAYVFGTLTFFMGLATFYKEDGEIDTFALLASLVVGAVFAALWPGVLFLSFAMVVWDVVYKVGSFILGNTAKGITVCMRKLDEWSDALGDKLYVILVRNRNR